MAQGKWFLFQCDVTWNKCHMYTQEYYLLSTNVIISSLKLSVRCFSFPFPRKNWRVQNSGLTRFCPLTSVSHAEDQMCEMNHTLIPSPVGEADSRTWQPHLSSYWLWVRLVDGKDFREEFRFQWTPTQHSPAANSPAGWGFCSVTAAQHSHGASSIQGNWSWWTKAHFTQLNPAEASIFQSMISVPHPSNNSWLWSNVTNMNSTCTQNKIPSHCVLTDFPLSLSFSCLTLATLSRSTT